MDSARNHDSTDTRARILVVEADEALREIIHSLLKSWGYSCDKARSAAEASDALESHGPWGLTLLSLPLPDLDGMVVLRDMKEKYPEMPVLVTIGWSEVEWSEIDMDKAAIERLGYEHISKPFSREQLFAFVRHALKSVK